MNETTEEIIELDSFNVTSDTLLFDGEPLSDVLLGKYRVIKQVTNQKEDTMEGNFFLLHEDYADESVGLLEYEWSEGGRFDLEDHPVQISNENIHYVKIEENTLGDKMIDVIDNTICFTMLFADFGYDYEVLKRDDKVVGFKVEGIGSYRNTPNKLFEQACKKGDLEQVRYLLHSPKLDKNADLAVENYVGYYWACTESHKELIKYFLTSPELKEHCHLGQREWTPFNILCNSNWPMAREILLDLPFDKMIEVKELLLLKGRTINAEDIQKIITIREMNEQLTNELLPKEMGKKIKI